MYVYICKYIVTSLFEFTAIWIVVVIKNINYTKCQVGELYLTI